MHSLAIIIPAAGLSTRYGVRHGKLLEQLAAKPVLRHSIAAFARRRDVRQIVIATPTTRHPIHTALRSSDWMTLTAGGANRAESVRNALHQVQTDIEWVAVHDAARPLVGQDLIDRTLQAALTHGAAVPALPVSLTVRRADGPLPAKSQGVIPRHNLFVMQTPQIMRRADLLAAFKSCPLPLDQITDDVQLLELAGKDVWLVPGDEANIKITTPLDLELAEARWSRQNSKA